MRGFLIAVVLVLTGLTFYSAFWHKSETIEQDITKRVTDELTSANAQGVDIDVDGRHVTLTGIVYDEETETNYLAIADDTYGALGPIDGLTYQADAGYVSAIKTDAGISLRGTVPDEDTRVAWVASASEATTGEVDDQLIIAGPKAGWQDEAQFGIAQLSTLTTGTLTAAAGAYALSGTTDDDANTVASDLENRDGWQAFISSPSVQTRMSDDINELRATITQRDQTIDGLQADLAEKDGAIADLTNTSNDLAQERDALASNLSDAEATIAGLNSDLGSSQQKVAAATATIAGLTASLSGKESEVAALEAELANRQQALGSTDDQVIALRAQVAEQQAGLADADQTIASLEGDLEARDASLADLSAKVSKLDAEVFTLDATLNSRDTTIANLTAQVSESSDTIANRDATIAALSANVDARDATIASLSGDGSNQAEVIEALNANITERDTTIASLNGELEGRDGVIAKLETDVADRDATIASLSGEGSARAAEIEALNNDIAERDVTIADLSGAVSERDGALSDASSQLAALTAAVATKDSQNGALQGQVADLTDVIAQRDATIASLQSQQGSSVSVAEQCSRQASSAMEGSRINFRSGTANLDQGSIVLLERLTGIALACVGDDLTVEIGGHTDSQGSDEANAALSEARAQRVLSFMSERGVPVDGLRAVGFGESQPIADNNTSAGRAENRRISFDWQAR